MAEGERPAPEDVLISAVLPVFNEGAILAELTGKLRDALDATGARWEVVYVNDGSSDDSGARLDALANDDDRVRVLHLSRNFGHQAALLAGLRHARGDAVVVMDSDMQDDPAAIGEMVEAWRAGTDVVYAVRFGRKENPLKKALFYSFYRVLNAISHTPMPNDAGNFGLVDKKVAHEIASLLDRDRYYPGLRQWVGFSQTGVEVERKERYDDTPRVSTLGLFRLAKTAIFSFSGVPLAVFYLLAAMSFLVFLALTAFTLYHRVFTGLAIPGWTSNILVGCFFGTINALGIAILGEYVIRIYDQVRARPLFVVDRRVNFDGQTSERARVPHAVSDEPVDKGPTS